MADLKPRIHIIGGPGSGKSHAAAKLANQFGIPPCDLDTLFWSSGARGYGIRADPAERDRQLAAIVSQNGWVIEGVYYEWLNPSFDAADIIIFLTPSVWVRHWRVIRRFILRKFGMVPSKRESFTDLWRLLRWSHGYDSKNLVRAREFIAKPGRKLVDCRTFNEVAVAINNLPHD